VQLVKGWFLPKKGLYVVQLQGVTDRNQAEALRDCQLLVPEDDRPALAEGEFHYLDLLGLRVVDQASQMAIGTITNLINAGNDLLEVELFPDLPREIFVPSKNKKPEDAKKPRRVLIPFVEPIVPIVDLAAGKVEITPPPGLLEF
jgi:16S rRNA processing protein RimM